MLFHLNYELQVEVCVHPQDCQARGGHFRHPAQAVEAYQRLVSGN